jgi:hypothetical protein
MLPDKLEDLLPIRKQMAVGARDLVKLTVDRGDDPRPVASFRGTNPIRPDADLGRITSRKAI